MIHAIQPAHKRYDTRLYCNLVYDSPASECAAVCPLHLHLIRPRGLPGECFPLLIHIGGGGWRVSSPERHLPELTHFAEQGYVVASVEYRTTAVNRFPAQIADVRTAIRYLRANSSQFAICPSRVFAIGESAGAYLAAMAALTSGSDMYRGSAYTEQSDALNGAICLYGIYDFEQLSAEEPASLPVRLFLPDIRPDALRAASPITYVRAETPFLLLHGTGDTLVSSHQSVLFHDALTAAGADAQLYLVDNANHADTVFSQPDVQKIISDFLSK